MDDNNSNTNQNNDLDQLLAKKEELENLIKQEFTRHITVMFTDLKGSTAIADLQGDLAARMIIKKHNDILIPIFRNNQGVLVKTMGDGTMSYFESELNAVRAALEIQKSINKYNETIEGQSAIRIRVGVSSGKGIVEQNDIFGDVVNVASRFESSCEPGEIYISEGTYEGLGDAKEEFFIRHVRNITFKGKSDESKVYKVFYKPEEIEKEKNNPTDPYAVEGEEKGTQGIARVDKTALRGRRVAPLNNSNLVKVNVTDIKESASIAEKELKGGIVKAGEVVKLVNNKYRVLNDIIVVKGAVLVIENSELFFEENAGILALGAVRAKNTTFTSIDPARGWRNLSISSQGDRTSELMNCKFHFGRGRTLESLKISSDMAVDSSQRNLYYGGGLFVMGGSEKTLRIKDTNFFRCTSNEGGGAFFSRSAAKLENCIFEGCIAKTGNGGGIATFGSDLTLNKCAFNKCSSGKQGGGASFTNSKNKIMDSVFRSCMSKLGGGGLAFIQSSPLVNDCRFERCISAKRGGGLYKDLKSNPTLACPSFDNCKPDNMV